jgi:hypothetical protein
VCCFVQTWPNCRGTHAVFISFLQAPPIKRKVHSDITLWYSPLRLVIAFVFVFVFVRKFPFRSLGYNTPKVFETVFAFFDCFVLFLPMIICSTFRLALSIRGSLDTNVERRRRSSRDAIVTVPLLYVPPYYVLCLMCVYCVLHVSVDKNVVTKNDDPSQVKQVSTTEVVNDSSPIDVVQYAQPKTSLRFPSSS